MPQRNGLSGGVLDRPLTEDSGVFRESAWALRDNFTLFRVVLILFALGQVSSRKIKKRAEGRAQEKEREYNYP